MSRIDDARARRGPGPIEKAWTSAGIRWAGRLTCDPFESYVAMLLHAVGFFMVGITLGIIVGWLA